MYSFNDLSETEQREFLKYPAYLSLLAVNKESFEEDDLQQPSPFDHLETFNCHPLLAELYRQAALVYQPNLELLDNQLPKGKLERDVAIKIALRKIKGLLRKLDPAYAALLQRSMKAFKEHVSEKQEHVLDDFLFPIPIKELPDAGD